jgi:antirestriction protein ArdC
VGRHVKKGETSAYIFVPRIVSVPDGEDGEEKKELRGFLVVPVFGYAQTDGEPIGYEPRTLPPLMDVAERLGVSVSWEPCGGALGSVDQDGQRIRVMSHDAAPFFHELAHAVHARLNGRLRGGQDAHQETVAELAVCVLAQMYGFGDVSGSAWHYICHYNADPLLAIMEAMADVEAILSVIIDGL